MLRLSKSAARAAGLTPFNQKAEATRRVHDRGRAISIACARPEALKVPADANFAWMVAFTVPFSYSASKNALWGHGRGGRTWLTPAARAIRRVVADACALAVREAGVTPRHNRLWLDLVVQKPDHRGDAVNVLDLCCDGLKQGLGLDDNWFSVRRLDWQVAKHDPQLYFQVGQVDHWDAICCAVCGRLLPPHRFPEKKGGTLGRGRDCLECLGKGSSRI